MLGTFDEAHVCPDYLFTDYMTLIKLYGSAVCWFCLAHHRCVSLWDGMTCH